MAVESDFESWLELVMGCCCFWTHLEVSAYTEETVSFSLVVDLLADSHTAFVLVGNLSCF